VVGRGEPVSTLNYKNIDLNQGTVRMWVDKKVLSMPGDKYLFAVQGSTDTINSNRLSIKISEDKVIEFRIINSSGVPKYVTYNAAAVASTFFHVEATWDLDGSVVDGGVYRMNLFVNGSNTITQYGNAAASNITMSEVGNMIFIGANGYTLYGDQYTEAVSGLIDDFEIANYVRHLSSFVPPTAGLTPDAYTRLLARFDQSTGIKLVQGVDATELMDESGGSDYARVNSGIAREVPDYQKKDTVLFNSDEGTYFTWMAPYHPVYNKPASNFAVLPDAIAVYRHGEKLKNDSWVNVTGGAPTNRTAAMSSTGEIVTAYTGQNQWDTIQIDYKVGLDETLPVFAGLTYDGSFLYSGAGLRDIVLNRPTAYLKYSPFYGEQLRSGLNSTSGEYPGMDVSWDEDNLLLWALTLEGGSLNNRISSINRDTLNYDTSFYLNIEAIYPKSVYGVIRELSYINSDTVHIYFDVVIQALASPYRKYIKTIQVAKTGSSARVVTEVGSIEVSVVFPDDTWGANTNTPLYYDGLRYLYMAVGSQIYKMDRTEDHSVVEVSDARGLITTGVNIRGIHLDHDEYFWVLEGNSQRMLKIDLNALSGEGTISFPAAYGEIHSTVLTEDICSLEEPVTADFIHYTMENIPVYSFTRMVIDGMNVVSGDTWTWVVNLTSGLITFTSFAPGESDMQGHNIRVDYISNIPRATLYTDTSISQNIKALYSLSNDGTSFEKVIPSVDHVFVDQDNHTLMLKSIISDESALLEDTVLNTWVPLSTPNIFRAIPVNKCCSQLSLDGNEHSLRLNSTDYSYVPVITALTADNQYTVVDGVVYIFHSGGVPSETDYRFTYYTERNVQVDITGLLVLSS